MDSWILFGSDYYFRLLRQKKETNMPNLQEVEHFGAMIRHTPTRSFFLKEIGVGLGGGFGEVLGWLRVGWGFCFSANL